MIREEPEYIGLDTGVWTAPIVGDLVKQRSRIAYSPSQIHRIRHDLCSSLQYPRQELSQAVKKRQSTWIEEELPEEESPRRQRNPDV
jgi:transposase